MAKLNYLKIIHYRGVEMFEQTFRDGITCIIGRGDSGKSTILNAIACLFAHTWSIHLTDSDFYGCNMESPIIIEGVVSAIPNELIKKFRTHLRGILKDGRLIDDMESEDAIDADPALSVRLTVGKDLEPIWEVVSYNGEEPSSIKANDRAKLNVYAISDYTDRHFSMNKGNPLYNLYKQLCVTDVLDDDDNAVLDIVREAKSAFDDAMRDKFDNVINIVKEEARKLGVTINEMKAMLDYKDIAINESKVSVHEDGIPYRLKGKGSKRLLSLAIQMALTEPSGIILIDEIEQGLEPDRVRHLVNILSKYSEKQILITTHSSNVIVELPCESLYIMRQGSRALLHVEGEVQGSIRKNPESFFSKKVLICEGATEIGICRALNDYQQEKGLNSMTCLGVCLADGHGRELEKYVIGFKELGYDTALLCDSDDNSVNKIKQKFKEAGVVVIDCDEQLAFEQQLFKDVNWDVVQEEICLCYKYLETEDNLTFDDAKRKIFEQVFTTLGKPDEDYDEHWLDAENNDLRMALGTTAKKNSWYKRIDKASSMMKVVFAHMDELSETSRLRKEFIQLNDWINT